MFSLSFRSLCRRSHRILIRVMAISAFLGVFGLLGTGRLLPQAAIPEVDRLVRRRAQSSGGGPAFFLRFRGNVFAGASGRLAANGQCRSSRQ